jgi:hypothetical protein
MSARDRAGRLLAEVLAGGTRPVAEVEALAAEQGVSVRTLRRAADDLAVIRTRDGRRLLWALPPEAAPAGGRGSRPTGAHSVRGIVPPAGAPYSIPSSTDGEGAGLSAPSDDREVNDMTDDNGTDYVMCTDDGLTWPGAGVLARGDVVALPERGTAEWEATCDRHGASFLDDLSRSAQTARWGRVMLARLDKSEVQRPADDAAANDLDADPAPAPIRPDRLPAVLGPGLAARPEGSVPFLTSSGEIVPDRR